MIPSFCIPLFWAVGLGLLAGIGYGLYFCLSLPLRRRERARLFLDLIETGLSEGRSPEETIVGAGASGDPRLGLRFHLLAAHLESGFTLGQALERVPRLLPPAVAAMLRTGLELGDPRAVLPVCRQRLEDSVPAVWNAYHYLMLLAAAVTPVWIWVFVVLMVYVVPRLLMIAEDMGGGTPALLVLLRDQAAPLVAVQAVLAVFIYATALVYLGGPRLVGWVRIVFPMLPDRIACAIPWTQRRMQRDFAAMLGALLDAEVPEAQALERAAQSTANAVWLRRARAAVAALGQGVGLAEAVRHLDAAGEFRWRLANAARQPRHFQSALAGWQEALSARAFQLEQSTAQVVTTGFVLLNGAFVGTLCVSVFLMLIYLIEVAALW